MEAPRGSNGMMNRLVIMDFVTTDNYSLSIKVEARKGSKFKFMQNLLPALFVSKPRSRSDSISLPHLLGDQADGPHLDNVSQNLDRLSLYLCKYLTDTWQLVPLKRHKKWNLQFSLLLTNSEGLVLYDHKFLNWYENSVKSYLAIASRTRKIQSLSEIITGYLSFNEDSK